MYHYVYRITDKKREMYYIGSRSSDLKPEDDLGSVYFSSSSNNQFLKDQKNDPSRFIYEIIKEFPNENQAVDYERRLIEHTNARNDPDYYNGRMRLGFSSIDSRATKSTVSYLGNLIKLARKERGMSQEELAERLNIGRSTVNRIEAGNTKVSIGTVFEACFLVGIPLFGCDEKHIHNLSTMMIYMHKLIPERIANKIVVDDF